MITKKLIAIGAAAVLSIGLAGCGGGGGNPGGSDTNASDAIEPEETITLSFQSLSDQPGAIEATKHIVDSWNQENPKVQVEIIQAGWDGVYDKLLTQFSGNSAPDIIHYEAASIIPFAADGYLRDLTDDIPDNVKSDISEGVWNSVTINNKIIAMPTELQAYVVFANKTLLEEAGVEIPSGETMTWDQFAEIAAATTKGDVFGLGWGLKSPTATMMALGMIDGAKFFDGEGDDVGITIGDAEVALPVAIRKLAEDGSLDPVSLTQSGSDVLKGFYAGKYAMTVQGSYQAANMTNDSPEGFKWIELPPLEGSAGVAQAANPQTISVNIDSKYPAWAAKFALYFTSAENMAQLNQADALIPASRRARETILEETGGENGWDMTMKAAEHLEGAPYLKVNNYAQWKDTIATPAFQKFLVGEIDEATLRSDLESGWER